MITFISNLAPNVVLNEGDSTALSVSVSSRNPSHNSFKYTWKKDGIVISGATTDTISIASAVPATHDGVYLVTVDDLDAGSAILNSQDSVASTVTVTPAAPTGGPVPGRSWEEHYRLRNLGYT